MVALVGGLLGFGAGAKETSRLEKVERDEAFKKEKEENARQLASMRTALLKRRADQEDTRLAFAEEQHADARGDIDRANREKAVAFARKSRTGQGRLDPYAQKVISDLDPNFPFNRQTMYMGVTDDIDEGFGDFPTGSRVDTFAPHPTALEAQASLTAGVDVGRKASAAGLDDARAFALRNPTPDRADLRAGRKAERDTMQALVKVSTDPTFREQPVTTQNSTLQHLVRAYNTEVEANGNTIYLIIKGKRTAVRLGVTRPKDSKEFTYTFVYTGPDGKEIPVRIQTEEMKGILEQLIAKLPSVERRPLFKTAEERRKRARKRGEGVATKVIGEAVGTLVKRAKLPPGRGGRAHARKMKKSISHDALLQKQREIKAARAKALQGR